MITLDSEFSLGQIYKIIRKHSIRFYIAGELDQYIIN